jgi:hypothetical protein
LCDEPILPDDTLLEFLFESLETTSEPPFLEPILELFRDIALFEVTPAISKFCYFDALL